MTVLRQQMIEDMQLRGLAPRTQEAYLAAMKQLARYYRQPPEQISEGELRHVLYVPAPAWPPGVEGKPPDPSRPEAHRR